MELHVDIETKSDVDLTKLGVYRYAEDPGFQVLLFAYAYDDDPVKVIDLAQGEEFPAQVLADLVSPNVMKRAFNAQFERVCLDTLLGEATGPWHCSMIQANALGLRGTLATVGEAVGTREDEQKLFTGKNLIRLFCLRRKPTWKNGMREIYLPEDRPQEWELFKEYCGMDVVAERAIQKKLDSFPLLKSEQELYLLDQKINDRGIKIDLDLATAATEVNNELFSHYEDKFTEITGLDSPKKLKQFKEWILRGTGETVDSITKGTLPILMQRFQDYPEVVAALEIRDKLSRTSVAKYDAMDQLACQDSRARGLFRFYGASTGRWTGKGLQPQNLPQNHIDDLDTARAAIRQRDLESLEMFYDDPADIMSQCIRTALIPEEGNVFLVADFSAIEARVIAWIAGEAWRLEVFNSHGKIYEASASAMFNVPLEAVTKGSPLRQKGKIAELALGYGGGVGALKAMGALRMGIPEEHLSPLVASWRLANPAIVDFWANTEAAAKRAITSKRPQRIQDTDLGCSVENGFLFMELPNGRRLSYPKPSIRPHPTFAGDEITYQETSPGGWQVKGTYGGRLVENIVQATARDCLADKMLTLDKAGYDIVMHVHDEVVIEVPAAEAEEALERVLAVMAEPLPWAPGLPLNADGYICEYYQKD